MKICCLFSLESPHLEDSNKCIQHTFINIKNKTTQNYPKYSSGCSYWIFCKGLKNEFEIAVVHEPSVFEPLKFYCMSAKLHKIVSRLQPIKVSKIADADDYC